MAQPNHQRPAAEVSDKRGYTIAEACRYLGISHTTAYELIAKGQLRTYTIGRARRTTRDWMDELIARGEAH